MLTLAIGRHRSRAAAQPATCAQSTGDGMLWSVQRDSRINILLGRSSGIMSRLESHLDRPYKRDCDSYCQRLRWRRRRHRPVSAGRLRDHELSLRWPRRLCRWTAWPERQSSTSMWSTRFPAGHAAVRKRPGRPPSAELRVSGTYFRAFPHCRGSGPTGPRREQGCLRPCWAARTCVLTSVEERRDSRLGTY